MHHDHFQILFGLDGVLELEVDGRGQRIAAGDGCVVPPGERHDFERRRRAGVWCSTANGALGPRDARAPRHRPARALTQYLAQSLHADHTLATLYGPLLLLEAWHRRADAASAPAPIDWDALARWAVTRHARAADGRRTRGALLPQRQRTSPRAAATNMGTSTQHWLRGAADGAGARAARPGLASPRWLAAPATARPRRSPPPSVARHSPRLSRRALRDDGPSPRDDRRPLSSPHDRCQPARPRRHRPLGHARLARAWRCRTYRPSC